MLDKKLKLEGRWYIAFYHFDHEHESVSEHMALIWSAARNWAVQQLISEVGVDITFYLGEYNPC